MPSTPAHKCLDRREIGEVGADELLARLSSWISTTSDSRSVG